MRVIWIPKHGNPVPEPEHAEVVPGESVSITGVVPSAMACRWLEVWVDMPDGTGRGTLKLDLNGQSHSQEELRADALWTSLVLP